MKGLLAVFYWPILLACFMAGFIPWSIYAKRTVSASRYESFQSPHSALSSQSAKYCTR